jgi:hypothetical protein
MSFSVSIVGKADAIKRRLVKECENLSGQSREELEAVRPALETILDQNVNDETRYVSVLHLEAHGHAEFRDGVKVQGQCTVNVRSIGPLAE